MIGGCWLAQTALSATVYFNLPLLFASFGVAPRAPMIRCVYYFRLAEDGVHRANWLTWRTRIGLQYALLEATVGKLHNDVGPSARTDAFDDAMAAPASG